MHYRKLSFPLLFLIISLSLVTGPRGFSQIPNNNTILENRGDSFENIYLHWFIAVDKARISTGVSRTDFEVFTRFSEKPMDSLRADFMKRIGDKSVTLVNVGKYESVIISAILSLYSKYENVKRLYPSSVEEFKSNRVLPPGLCDSACNNIDFENGTLSGWNAYYAYNNSSTSFSVTNITGGPAGAVAHAANDVLTSTAGFYNSLSVGANPSPDYQINITSGSRGDGIAPSVPVVSPFGGRYSIMLGDSTQVNYGVAILSQTFLVTPTNENFTYQYAVFLANPLHNYYEQPFFTVALLDQNGDTIPHCGEYNVVSGNGTQNFDSLIYTTYYPVAPTSPVQFTVYYKNWTIVEVPLKKYLGQCVTVVFEAADCSLGGHFGYAYVDASCSPNGVISSSPNLCGQDSISLTAPPGGSRYIWTGPTHGIVGSSGNQTVWVDSAGVYRVIIVPVTGIDCADTLYDTVGKVPGPPPRPDFNATTTCAGETTHFINTSTDTAGATFYWDFYNIGVYNDSNVVDPTWTYASPGTYTIKLDEVYNGCGADTLITITINPPPIASFSVSGQCVGTAVTTANTSTGATKYLWNYGDPASAPHDTSSAFNGSHIYLRPGTYTITLIANNSGACPDTAIETVTVYPTPKPIITGLDTVCPNFNDILTATGGTTYAWSNGATTSTIIASIAATQTFTVTASNGHCTHDTTFTVRIISPAPVIRASRNSVCAGDSTILNASGGLRYRWSTGSTLTSIVVRPFVSTTYTLYATIGDCTDSTTITISILQAVSCTLNISEDSICRRSPTIITVNASGGSNFYYRWSTGQTTSTISPSPNSTTIYTVQISNGFCIKDTSILIYVKMAPTLVMNNLIDTLCLGESVVLNASGAHSYSWSPTAGLSCIHCPDPTANPNTTTTYVVIGSDTDGCKDSSSVYVLVDTHPVLAPIPDLTTCPGDPVTLIANEISGFNGRFLWEPGGSTTQSITVSPLTTTTYTITYTNVCGDTSTTVTVTVKPNPVPYFSADVTAGCSPLCVQFRDLSTFSNSGNITMWSWNFGNGARANEQDPIYCYPDTGKYTVSLTAVSSNGCSSTLEIINMITVFSNPIANFIYSPTSTNILEPTVQFTDKSTDAYGIVAWNWTFGDATDSIRRIPDPSHTYQDTGTYCPQLIVQNIKGCVDTNKQCLEINPVFTLYIPDAFTPNGDGLNESFKAKGTYIKNFEMYIFDRWGMELFHATDINDGWPGTVKGGSTICQEDVYVYKITATDWSNTQHNYVGRVTLIK